MNIALGICIVLFCSLLQVSTIVGLRLALRRLSTHDPRIGHFVFETMIFGSVIAVLFFGMLAQVLVWAAVFIQVGEISDLQTAFYFSLVNFTTLGYGDIVLSKSRAILGPMEASNGVLMLGLSTSFLYSVAQKLRDR
jgi:ion channel